MKEEHCVRTDEDPAFLSHCRERLEEKERGLDASSEVFKLLGNPLRVRILFLLLQGRELCVCDLADVIGSRIPALSQQLRRLHDRGLLERRRNGRTIYYSVAPSYEGALRTLLEAFDEEKKEGTEPKLENS